MYFFILKMKCLFNLLTEFKIKKIYINLHILIFIIFANVWHFLIVIVQDTQQLFLSINIFNNIK